MTPKKEAGKSETLEKSPVRMAAEDRRHQILDIAVQLFSQKGFRGTTTKEIAQAIGINEAIIFRHFATKSELYAAIIDQKACTGGMQEMEAQIQAAMEARNDRLLFESMAFYILEFHTHDQTAMRLMLYSALEGKELSRMIFRQHIVQKDRQMAAYLKKRIAEGAIRPVDPMTAVRVFGSMVMGQAMSNSIFGDEARELLNLSNRQIAKRFTDIFLAGIRAEAR